jgi:hypothetical protein
MAIADPIKWTDSIWGVNYLPVRAAAAVVARENVQIGATSVVAYRDQATVVTVFSETSGNRRNVGVRDGANAPVDANTLQTFLSRPDQLVALDRIRGQSFLAIRVGEGLFQAQFAALDLSQYKIEVIRDGEKLELSFIHKDRESGTRGAVPGRPGFEVELIAADLSVVKAHFVR